MHVAGFIWVLMIGIPLSLVQDSIFLLLLPIIITTSQTFLHFNNIFNVELER